MSQIAHLPDRAVVHISGADRVSFLQGLVSHDVTLVRPGRAVWAALLTPQGKYLADFFILARGDALLLDVERAQADLVVQRLSRYRLRAAVTLRLAPEWSVAVAWGEAAGVAASDMVVVEADPRLPDAGWRILARELPPATAGLAAWDAHRIALGLPDGSRDLEPEKSVLLEAGFDELDGVSWTKGCYMGQELTARTKYRGLVKRRLVTVHLAAAAKPGTVVTKDQQEVGVLRSVAGLVSLALIRVDALAGPLAVEGAPLAVAPASWMRWPVPA